MKISVGYTARNEADLILKTLTDAVHDMDQLGIPYEIIVVDNASKDNTAGLAEEFSAKHPQVRVVKHQDDLGYARSTLTAFMQASGDVVAVVDSDGQLVLRDMPKFLSKIDGGADVVFGWRKQRNDPTLRKFVSVGMNQLAKRMLRWELHDINCGFRVVTSRVAQSFASVVPVNYFGPELWVHSLNQGFVVEEVIVEHFERKGGTSIHVPWRLPLSIKAAYDYLKLLAKRLPPL